MGCAQYRFPGSKGGTIFMCGPGVHPNPCRDCRIEAEFFCDYPVGNNKTCDAKLCEVHAHEIAPNIHYCNFHYEEWKKFDESGSAKERLDNVVPYAKRYLK